MPGWDTPEGEEPVLIYSHIPCHLCVNSSVKPPTQKSVEVALDIKEGVFIEVAIINILTVNYLPSEGLQREG